MLGWKDNTTSIHIQVSSMGLDMDSAKCGVVLVLALLAMVLVLAKLFFKPNITNLSSITKSREWFESDVLSCETFITLIGFKSVCFKVSERFEALPDDLFRSIIALLHSCVKKKTNLVFFPPLLYTLYLLVMSELIRITNIAGAFGPLTHTSQAY